MSTIDTEVIARPSRARIVVATPQLIVGLVATGLWVAQFAFGVHWVKFDRVQANTVYQLLTGLLLAIFLVRQFGLGLARMRKRTSHLRPLLAQHKWQGTLAPILFYVHSTSLGYAYTLVLSSVYHLNGVVGLFNADVVRSRSRLYIVIWMIAHVALAVLTVALTMFHAWVVLAY